MLLSIFSTFFKIGLFGFGGGYAMLPYIEELVVNTNHWITKAEFSDILGISQMTPGPVSINTATFVGYKVSGIIGGIVGTIGVIIFSVIVVIILSKNIDKLKNNKYVAGAIVGMKPVLIALIISAFYSLAKDSYFDFKSIIIGIITLVLLQSKKIHPILVIVIAAILGILFY
ncbi:MAG: chromate transporter [Sarcina sp.]